MDLWRPPHDSPQLFDWWRPLMLASQRARAERIGWPIYLDQFQLIGRVNRQGRPNVWIYQHHQSRGDIYVDGNGDTYRFIETPRARGIGMFKQCEIRRAVYGAGLANVVDPIFFEPQHYRYDDDWDRDWKNDDEDTDRPTAQAVGSAAVAPTAAANEPPTNKRRHLRVVGGSS